MVLPPASVQCIVKPVGGGGLGPGSEIGGGGQTVGSILQLPEDAVWVRFRFTCWSADALPIAAAAYSPTSRLGDGYNAYDAAGAVDTAGWRPITFGHPEGQSCMAQLAANGDDAVGAVVPGVGGGSARSFEPAIVHSDWMPFSPLGRGDGGQGCLINIRLYVAPGHPAYKLSHAAAPATELGYDLAGGYAFGHHAAWPFGGWGASLPVCAVYGLDLICARPTRTLIIAGDSIGSGDSTTGASTCYGLAAAQALAKRHIRVTAAVLANPAQTTRTFVRNCHRYIAADATALGGGFIVMQCWSGNDEPTLAAAEHGFAMALALAQFCQARGISPILATAAPVCAAAPEVEPARLHANALVRAAGLPCLDLDQILGSGASPNAYRPGFGAWDNVHVSDAGHWAAGEALVALLIGLGVD